MNKDKHRHTDYTTDLQEEYAALAPDFVKSEKVAENCIFEKLKEYRINTTEYFKFNDMDENEIDEFIDDIFIKYKLFIET